jgi:ribosome biogenesis GTPase
VVTAYGHRLVVEADDGGLNDCSTRQNLPRPVAGDRVLWQHSGGHQGVIVSVAVRGSVLAKRDHHGQARALAANVDLVVVVCAPIPPLNEFLIDRYLVAVEDMGVDALLIINKTDLLNPEEMEASRARMGLYSTLGYELLATSKHDAPSIAALESALAGRTAVMVGQSGVGKSSLVRTLLPGRDVAVGALSAATGFGTHTTTNASLYHLPGGGSLIDSPGVRGFEPTLTEASLDNGFRELRDFLGHCRFSDCSHTVEPKCRLREALAAGQIDPRRFQSYLQLRAELMQNTVTGGTPGS